MIKKAIAYIKESLDTYYPESEISGFARLIIEYLSGQSYFLAVVNNRELDENERNTLKTFIERLRKYEPIQYMLEGTEFFGLPFYVNKDVLIPRPETEELVELILTENKSPGLAILDIGTGSGAIAVALAKHLDNAEIYAWDFCPKALDVAKKNAQANSMDITCKLVDILADYPSGKHFDIIVSNPPYILEKEKQEMDQNVLEYEPHAALFVPDDKALLFYERIADIALVLLNPNGKLYFEINRAKGKETLDTLEKKGFTNLSLFQDLSGNDRMVRAEIKR